MRILNELVYKVNFSTTLFTVFFISEYFTLYTYVNPYTINLNTVLIFKVLLLNFHYSVELSCN